MSDGDAETLAAIRAKADLKPEWRYRYTDAMADVRWLLAQVGQLEAAHRELLEAARDYLDNGGKGQPRGIQADLWNRLVDVVTDQEVGLPGVGQVSDEAEKQVCPDYGTCHHECVGGCFRVVYCAPLTSPQTPDGVWPTGCVEVHGQLESWRL